MPGLFLPPAIHGEASQLLIRMEVARRAAECRRGPEIGKVLEAESIERLYMRQKWGQEMGTDLFFSE